MDNLIQDLYWLERPPKNFQTLCDNLINKKNNKDFLRVIENLSKKKDLLVILLKQRVKNYMLKFPKNKNHEKNILCYVIIHLLFF